MSKRVRLTQTQYQELSESRDWCHRNGLEGLRRFYDEELAFQARRRALPPDAREYREREAEEERPRRRRD